MNGLPLFCRVLVPLICMGLGLANGLAANREGADLILYNGSVITADKDGTLATAMAIKGDRILAVGGEGVLRDHRAAAAEVVNLHGRSVIPGLIDSHTHPAGASMTEFDHPIPRMRSIADVLAYIGQRALAVPKGQWIVVQQVFITRLKEQRYPTRAELDQAAPDHFVVFRTGPDASLNSRALAHFHIDSRSEAPRGSRIEKDPATGEPTGILRGWSGMMQIPPSGKSPTDQDRYERLLELFHDYNAIGITSIADRDASAAAMHLYQRVLDRGDLTLRLALSRSVSYRGSAEDITRSIRSIAAEPLSQATNLMLRTVGIKMFLDGGMLTGSAYMTKPWGVSKIYGIDDPRYRGLRFIPDEKLLPAVRAAVENGLQFTAHSVGDGAVEALVHAYARVARERPIRATRPNVTHCNFVSPELIRTMAALGISADMQPAWLYLDTRTLTTQFSDDRMRWFQPLRTFFSRGVIIGGGSDHMQKIGSMRSINPYNPFLGMWTAITRQARDFEGSLHPEESLSRRQALRFYTANNAYLLFQEKATGTLERGKLADFVILDRDFLKCPVDEIKAIQPRATYLGGRAVFRR